MKNEEGTIGEENKMVVQFPGSLRDYFAGQVIKELVNDCIRRAPGPTEDEHNSILMPRLAKLSYQQADAMLKEREK